MDKIILKKRLEELESEQKIIELNFHRVGGAIAILKDLLAKENAQPVGQNN